MGQLLLLLVVALTVAAVVFGVTVLVTGSDPGLGAAEPDARAVPLPGARPLVEADVTGVRFDTAVRGYRMTQVDQAIRRAAYDIGYKDELIGVLEAEVTALREGRTAEAEQLRQARDNARGPAGAAPAAPAPAPAATAEAPATATPEALTSGATPVTSGAAPEALASGATPVTAPPVTAPPVTAPPVTAPPVTAPQPAGRAQTRPGTAGTGEPAEPAEPADATELGRVGGADMSEGRT
jgi:DivIVA domain-containing protein